MGTLTSKLKLFKPATSDTVDVVADLNNNYDIIDTNIGTTICTSSTRPSGGALFAGLEIYETDTKKNYVYDGSAWQYVGAFDFQWQYISAGSQALTTALTDIAGATITITTVRPLVAVKVEYNVYLQCNTAVANSNAQMSADFDGTPVAGGGATWLVNVNHNGDRQTMRGSGIVLCNAAGSHTFKVRGLCQTTNGTFTANGTDLWIHAVSNG
jgi:hypothetical protein